MKKVDIAQTAQILANFGVIAGIIFLGIELRQNNELLAADAVRGYMVNGVETNQRLADSTEIVPLRLKSARGEQLTEAEQVRLLHDATASLTLWEWEWHQFEAGLLQESPMNRYRSVILRYPHVRTTLMETAASYDPGFIQWMEQDVLTED